MAKIQNSTTIKELRRAAGLSISEGFPDNLANSIVPVIEVNPKLLRTSKVLGAGTSSTSSSTASILTASSDKDTYITEISVWLQKDATSDNTAFTITALIDASVATIATFPTLTTTATVIQAYLTFSKPLKIDRGSYLRMGATFTVGALTRGMTAIGYEVEPFEN